MARKTKKEMLNLYRKGDRSPSVVKAWNATYKSKMKNRRADPNCRTNAQYLNQQAIARVCKVGGFVTQDPKEMEKIIDLYQMCHQMNRDPERECKWSVDHIIEISMGGSHTLNNLQIIPLTDNIKKSHKIRKASQINTRPYFMNDKIERR